MSVWAVEGGANGLYLGGDRGYLDVDCVYLAYLDVSCVYFVYVGVKGLYLDAKTGF